MKEAPPIVATWDGDHFVPIARFRRTCDHYFAVGQEYRLAQQEERSMKSHNHYFACIIEAWRNLPEGMAEHFPTPDILRKHALIRTGYCKKRIQPCENEAEAMRVSALASALLRYDSDTYAIVEIKGAFVEILTARSQSKNAMPGAREFQESKEAVLQWIADAIGVTKDALAANASRAA